MSERTAGRAAVLGAGPTGLLAGSQLSEMGFDVTVFSDRAPVMPMGSFYFHDLPDRAKKLHRPKVIYHRYVGNHFVYESKQWGITYQSSFRAHSATEELTIERKEGWWPTKELYDDLVSGLNFRVMKLSTPKLLAEIFSAVDFAVVTFPIQDIPHLFKTPMLTINREVLERYLGDGTQYRVGELFYDGIEVRKHKHIVRVTTTPQHWGRNLVVAELTKTSKLLLDFPHGAHYTHDLHPCQPRTVHDLPDHVLVAGRFATGNPNYLSSDVLEAIRRKFDDA